MQDAPKAYVSVASFFSKFKTEFESPSTTVTNFTFIVSHKLTNLFLTLAPFQSPD